VIAATATLTSTTTEKLLEAVFSVQSVLRLYNEYQQDKPVSLEMAAGKDMKPEEFTWLWDLFPGSRV
jgi:hypothetical protein